MNHNGSGNSGMNGIGKTAKQALDIVILSRLFEKPAHGYEIIKYIYDRYDLFLAPSHVYPLLYSLEKKGLLIAKQDNKRKVYAINEPEKARDMIASYLVTHSSFLRSLQRTYDKISETAGPMP